MWGPRILRNHYIARKAIRNFAFMICLRIISGSSHSDVAKPTISGKTVRLVWLNSAATAILGIRWAPAAEALCWQVQCLPGLQHGAAERGGLHELAVTPYTTQTRDSFNRQTNNLQEGTMVYLISVNTHVWAAPQKQSSASIVSLGAVSSSALQISA